MASLSVAPFAALPAVLPAVLPAASPAARAASSRPCVATKAARDAAPTFARKAKSRAADIGALVALVELYMESQAAHRVLMSWIADLTVGLEAQGFRLERTEFQSAQVQVSRVSLRATLYFFDPLTSALLVARPEFAAYSIASRVGSSYLEVTLRDEKDLRNAVVDLTENPTRARVTANKPNLLFTPADELRTAYAAHIQAGWESELPKQRKRAVAQFVADICARQSH